MAEHWTPAALVRRVGGGAGALWWCQLLHHELSRDALLLDLVALEDCPADPAGCPRHTLFTLHVERAVVDDPVTGEGSATWVAAADVVSVLCGTTEGGRSWLCLSDRGRLLVLLL